MNNLNISINYMPPPKNIPINKVYNTITKRLNTLKNALKGIKNGKFTPYQFTNPKLLWNTKDNKYVVNNRWKKWEEKKVRQEKGILRQNKIKSIKLAQEKIKNILNKPVKNAFTNIFQKYKDEPVFTINNTTMPNNFGVRSETYNIHSGLEFDILKSIVNRVNSKTIYASRLIFYNPDLNKYFSTATLGEHNIDDIMVLIGKVISSDEEYTIWGNEILVRYYDIPKGGSSVKLPKWLEGKTKSLCPISNTDNNCGQICVALGRADADRRKYLNSVKGKFALKNEVKKIINDTGLNDKMNIHDFNKVAEIYKDLKFIIFGDFYTIIEETDNNDYKKIIYIFWDSKEEHYHLITNINGFMNDVKGNYKYCEICKTRMLKKQYDIHKCKGLSCNLCFTQFNSLNELMNHKECKSEIACPKCNLKCRGEECLIRHIKGTDNRKGCQGKNWFYPCCLYNGYKINQCWGRPEDKEYHKCDHKYCSICEEYKPREHRCFIKPRPLKEKWVDNLIAFDFESRFDDEGRHYVNFIVAKERLTNDRKIWRYEKGKDILQEFIEWCFTKKNTTFIAHNGKAYDTWLIHRKICSNKGKRPNKLILAGNKIMYMKIDTIAFIDSINHFSMALEKAPSTFGLDEDKFKKGFYPYLFNTEDNWNYEGKIPAKKFYNPDAMKPKKRNEFLEWWNKKSSEQFIYNHAKETEEYCISDVDILLEACNKYSTIGWELTGIDPLTKTTIASWVMNTYLTKFYDFEKTPIAVLKKDEYDFIKKSFHGGRTETIRSYKKWSKEELDKGECGRYVDITSLYPSVQFYDEMPYGEPKWITENLDYDYIKNNYGFYEIDIEMNKKEFISPLVSHYDGKLTADVEDKNKRVFHSNEIINAVEVGGCKVLNVYKGLTFKKTTDMFKEFVSTFLRIKVEASGEPSFYNLKDNTKRIKWEQDHKNIYGFIPKPEKEENSGLRAIAKMILNSLWGKFGQRPDMATDKYISPEQIKEWYRILKLAKNGNVDLKTDEISGDHLFVSYVDNRDNNNTLNNTSIAIASSTTANAGIRLYKELKQLGNRVLYHDTDSIIYEYKPTEYNIKLGDYLGDWTCETNGKPIDEFVSCGAKSYSYKVDGKVKDTKMKGITLNFNNSKRICFDTMLELVNGEKEKLITDENIRFVKDKVDTSTLITKPIIKDVKMTMDKRTQKEYWTYPKGYEGIIYN